MDSLPWWLNYSSILLLDLQGQASSSCKPTLSLRTLTPLLIIYRSIGYWQLTAW